MIPASEPPHAVWRPYTDIPVLTPAMVRGRASVPETELDALRRFLAELVAVRQAPVHVCVAFNAAYFGYDLGGQGYGVAPLDPDAFPEVSFHQRVSALPVGAMVCLPTGADPLYAEIVYREGRHPALTPLGDLPEWLSGAPPEALGPGVLGAEDGPARDELLVPDFHAFGAALSPSSARLNRLRIHERWIDRRGHLTIRAHYDSAESAARDDTSAYIDYLLTTARAQLLSPLVPTSLVELAGNDDEESLRSALTALMGVVRGLLAESDQLRMWGPYAMTCASLTSSWQDSGPLGMADMCRLVSSLEHAPKPNARRRYGRPNTVTYTAVGPRLSDFPGAEGLLSGPRYARAVCRANFAISSAIARESDRGRFANGVWVGLDDAFLGGGVWRSCIAGSATAAAGLRADPATAGGEGWRSTVMPQAIPLDDPLPDEPGLGLDELLSVSASEVTWRVPLRLAHLVDGYLPLHSLVSAQLLETDSGHRTIRVELAHPGGALENSAAVQDTLFTAGTGPSCGRLAGIEWPLSFFPGLEVQVQWPREGRVLRVTTTLLDAPVTVDDHLIEHRYDPAVLTRDNAPGSSRTRDSTSGLTVRQMVLRAVRRCGLLTPDGHALFDRAALPRVLYSDASAAETALLTATVTDLLAAGDVYAATGSRGRDGVANWPERPGEPGIPLLGYEPALHPRTGSKTTGADATARRSLAVSHYVSGHLRRLGPGHTPSEEQRAAYRAYCRRLGKAGEQELPPHYTFIPGHYRCR